MFRNVAENVNAQPIEPRRDLPVHKNGMAHTQPIRVNLLRDNSKSSRLDLRG